jgi:hypothetical protein
MRARKPIRFVRAGVALAVAASALAAAGCGEEEKTTSFGDEKVIETLNLEKSEGGYAIGGDPFCEVDNNLLNDADEVDQAEERDDVGLVLASRQGNVGVRAVPPFAPDCQKKAKKQLDKLDPKPKES